MIYLLCLIHLEYNILILISLVKCFSLHIKEEFEDTKGFLSNDLYNNLYLAKNISALN